jgi:hypothetical protein
MGKRNAFDIERAQLLCVSSRAPPKKDRRSCNPRVAFIKLFFFFFFSVIFKENIVYRKCTCFNAKKKKENKVWEAKEKLSGAKRDEQDRIVFPSQKRWVDEDDGVELLLPPPFSSARH